MRDRFPKRKRGKKQKILEYTCCRCGDRHPFNRYCPYAIDPPIIPGECRSCATLTNVHDDGCEMVAIKDRIGLCAFCGEISHPYAECPERYPNGAPKRVMGRATTARESARTPAQDRTAPRPPAYYGVCSFCSSAGHGHEECPGLKEAIQEQAAQLARLQIVRYESARIVPPRERDDRDPGAEGHQPGPQKKGTTSWMGMSLAPGGGGDDDPAGDEGSTSGYLEDRGGLDLTGVAGVVEAHQRIQTWEEEMDSIRGPEEGVAPGATPGHWAPKDLGDPQDPPDGKETQGRSQELET